MLLKWIFTALALMWLYRVLSQLFEVKSPPVPPPGAPKGPVTSLRNADDDEGEYIDYEEIK